MYSEWKEEEIDLLMKDRVKTYGQVYYKDSVYARPNVLTNQPEILEGYSSPEGFGENYFRSYFDKFDLDQLQNLVEVRFIHKGAGYVDLYFRWGFTISAEMANMTVLATKAGFIKVRDYSFKWVDRY